MAKTKKYLDLSQTKIEIDPYNHSFLSSITPGLKSEESVRKFVREVEDKVIRYSKDTKIHSLCDMMHKILSDYPNDYILGVTYIFSQYMERMQITGAIMVTLKEMDDDSYKKQVRSLPVDFDRDTLTAAGIILGSIISANSDTDEYISFITSPDDDEIKEKTKEETYAFKMQKKAMDKKSAAYMFFQKVKSKIRGITHATYFSVQKKELFKKEVLENKDPQQILQALREKLITLGRAMGLEEDKIGRIKEAFNDKNLKELKNILNPDIYAELNKKLQEENFTSLEKDSNSKDYLQDFKEEYKEFLKKRNAG